MTPQTIKLRVILPLVLILMLLVLLGGLLVLRDVTQWNAGSMGNAVIYISFVAALGVMLVLFYALSLNRMARQTEEGRVELTKANEKLLREIEVRERAEDAVWKSEKKYRTLIEHIPQKIFSKDRNSVYTACNENYAKDLGIAPEAIVGRTDYDFYPRELADKYRADDARIMESKVPEEIDEDYIQDGEQRIVHTVKTPIKDESDNAIGIIGIFWDITERKQIEEALRESEQKYRALVESAPDAIFMLSENGEMLAANQEAARRLGRTPEQILGLNTRDLFPEKIAQQQLEYVKQVFETGAAIVTDSMPTLVAHNTHWYTTTLAPVKDANGAITSVLGISRDITERKRAEEALAESREKLRSIVDVVGIGIALISPKMEILELNRAMSEWFPSIDASQRPICYRVYNDPSREAPCSYCPTVKTLQDGQIHESITETPTGDTVRNYRIVSSALKDVDGNVIAAVEMVDDITERKRVEQSQERLVAILDATPDFVGFADANDAHILYINPAGRKMVGVGAEEDVTRLKIADVHPEWTNRLLREESMPTAIRDGIWTGECAFLNRDGREIPVAMVLLTHKSPSGEVERFSTISRDITERKQAEQKLRQYASELRRANEEVKQFAYIVSHDLRAPLINMKGFAAELHKACATIDSYMAEELPHLDDEQQQKIRAVLQQDIPEALEFIDASVGRMDSFINAVLLLSRLGRRELAFEKVNLGEVVQNVLKNLAHQLEKRQVKVTVGSLPEVVGDRTAMEQIVGNILANAVNYLEPGRTGEIEIGGEQRDGETNFFVRDNGRGIAETDMPKVFAPFRRAGKQDVKGEGMGLAYAQTLARRHGGEIRCNSELGVGTTFIVVLSNHPEKEGSVNVPTPAG